MDWNSDNDTSTHQPKPRQNSDFNDKCVFWYMCNVCYKAYSNAESFVTHRIEAHGPGIQPRELKPKPKQDNNAKDCNNNVALKSEYCLKLRNSIKSRDPPVEIQDKIEDLPEEIQNQNDRPGEMPNQTRKSESISVGAVAVNNDSISTTLPEPEPDKQHHARRRITQIEKKRRRHLTTFQKDCTNKLLKQVLISNFMKDNLITASPVPPRKIPFSNKDTTKKINILPKCFKLKWNFFERCPRELYRQNRQNPPRQSSRNSKGSSTHITHIMAVKPEHSEKSTCELLDPSKQSQSTDCEVDIHQVTVNDPDLSLCNSSFNFFENLKNRVNSRITFITKETKLTELSSSLTV